MLADIRLEIARRAFAEVRARMDADDYQRAQDGTFGSGPGIRGPAKPALQQSERAEHIKPEKEKLKAALAAHAANASPENARAVRDARNALKEKRAVAGSANPDKRAAEPKDRRAHEDKEADDKQDLRSADPDKRAAAEERVVERTPKGEARARQASEFFEDNTSEKELARQVQEIHADTTLMAEPDYWSAKGDFKEKAWISHVKNRITNADDVSELDVLKERLGTSGLKPAETRPIVQQAKAAYTERVKAALAIKPSERQLTAARTLHEATYGKDEFAKALTKQKQADDKLFAAKAPKEKAAAKAPKEKPTETTKEHTPASAHSSAETTPEGTTPGVERLPAATLATSAPQQIAETHLPRMISDEGTPYDSVWASDYMKATGTNKAQMTKMWADGSLDMGPLNLVRGFAKQRAKIDASELSRNGGDATAHVIRVTGKRT